MLHWFFPQHPATAQIHNPWLALLSGPPNSGKTSLLFQFAYNCCLDEEEEEEEDSSTVVFIGKRQKLEKKPPLLAQDVDAASAVFERVQMKYVDDENGIRKYFAAFHMLQRFPRAVIIDDFCDYFNEWKCRELYGQSRGKEIAYIRTLALCKDAMDHANNKLPGERCCKLLISDTHFGDGPRLLYLYQRWLSTVFIIQGLDSSTFMLKIHQNGNNGLDDDYAQYSMAEEYLRLEELQSRTNCKPIC